MKVTKRLIKKLKNGKVPVEQETPFIVVRQSVKLPFTTITFREWALITDPEDADNGYPLDNETAEAIMDANNMILVYSEPSGQIYELPGTPFKTLFNKTVKVS